MKRLRVKRCEQYVAHDTMWSTVDEFDGMHCVGHRSASVLITSTSSIVASLYGEATTDCAQAQC